MVFTYMISDFTTTALFSYDFKMKGAYFSKKFNNIVHALISFPLNIPVTTFYKCLKVILKLFFIIL